MKIKYFIIFGICMCIASCQNQKNDSHKNVENIKSENHFDLPDSLSTRRISFALQLKKSVAESTWLDFGEKRTVVFLHFYFASL